MTDLSDYHVSATDWRRQLRKNEFRTKIVIALFILIYLLVGFVLDLYLHSGVNASGEPIPLGQLAYALVTFRITPVATIILGLVATVSVVITFALHDRLILMGTQYREITPEGQNSLAEKQFYNVVEEMKVAAGLRYMPKVYIIDAEFMNAFASGYSEKSALIAVTKGLMKKLSRSELQAVVAHELSHIRHHDIKLTLMASVLSNILLIVIDFLFYNILFSERGGKDNRLALIVMLLRFLLPIMTIVLMLYLSRTREYMADAGAVELMRDNEPLSKALIKINEDYEGSLVSNRRTKTAHEDVRRAAYIFDPSKARIRDVPSVTSFFSTHPSLKERLQALGFK